MAMRSRWSFYLTSLIVASLSLFLILQSPRLRAPLHAVIFTALSPVLDTSRVVGLTISGTRSNLIRFWKTFRQEASLRLRVEELESKMTHYEEIQRENSRLIKLLDFKKTIPEKTIAAQVVGADLSPMRRTLLINKGTAHKLKKDMAVITAEGLVGRILEIGPFTARVILLTDPNARVSALTSESRAQGVISGAGTPKLLMRYLDLDGGVAIGETVITSGISGIFPKEIRIGVVESISRDPDGLHLVARVQPLVSFSKLEEVLCLESSQAK